jgi:TolA-binding protein
MSTRLFAFFILIMLFGVQSVFFSFQNQLDGKQELVYEIEILKKQLEEEKLKTEVAYFQLESFKQKVAIALPKNIPQQEYSVRSIASFVTDSKKPLDINIDLKFSQIKKLYKKNQFESAALKLKEFIQTYPESSHVLEAYYLLVMSYYESSQFDSALKTVDILVEQFPASEMTGLGLLVTGDIMLKKERYDEAKEVYQTVQNKFPFPELKKQAQKKLEDTRL